MNAATPTANSNKSTIATSLRNGALNTTTANTVITTKTAVSVALSFTIFKLLLPTQRQVLQ